VLDLALPVVGAALHIRGTIGCPFTDCIDFDLEHTVPNPHRYQPTVKIKIGCMTDDYSTYHHAGKAARPAPQGHKTMKNGENWRKSKDQASNLKRGLTAAGVRY
jgi:hypothetical protein